ncbi:hypothetical protein Q5424_06680 [Conexibacter sp. JD483]|uniref:hypothetical protein n=1 Tax=unclassified Conexibacter TaxID=2627773 RepID=UPI002716FE37|nr:MULTISPECIES: hypothetical protein [unclassified Conexibacter]MDO8185345.1 hypothetical protein [Conexibacter sp. CPCC 205706]MDO8198479.1 hypothetical protein [Conexibacter sp. CPCC 205762]MDR9368756.1 hypothetical protein [Conexibacter sp. JD483]
MRPGFRRLLALAALTAALPAMAATAAGAAPAGAGSWKLQPLRVPDPDGGPPWGVATARGTASPGAVRPIACYVAGRVVDGRLGTLDAAGAFQPYAAGAGPWGCGSAGIHADRYPMTNNGLRYAQEPGTPCAPGSELPLCGLSNLRTVRFGVLGPHIRSAVIVLFRSGQPPTRTRVPVTRDGVYLLVGRGWDGPLAEATIFASFSTCGASARRDLEHARIAGGSGCRDLIQLPGNTA